MTKPIVGTIINYLPVATLFILFINTFAYFYKNVRLKRTFKQILKMDLSDYVAASSEKRGYRAYLFVWNNDYDDVEEIRKAKRGLRKCFRRQIYIMVLFFMFILYNIFMLVS